MAGRIKRARGRMAAQASNRRRRKRRRTGKKTLYYILLVVFLLAAGAVLSLTTFFKIEQITVVGTDKYTPNEIEQASGIRVGENLFRVSGTEVEKALKEQFPYIEAIEIRRRLPPAIEIRVTQSKPEAAVMEGDQVVLITRGGKVLERGKLLIPAEVPAIQGLDTTGVKPGEELPEEAKDGLRMLEYLFGAIDSTGFSKITNVDISNPLNMMVIYENRLLLKLGTEANLEHKLTFVMDVLEKIGDDAQGRIDVSNVSVNNKLNYKSITLAEALALEKKDKPESENENSSTPVQNTESGENGEMSGNIENAEKAGE